MTQTKRRFTASFCVRFDTTSVRFELSPAEDHGGNAGMYRVRRDRVWLDDESGQRIFFDRKRLSEMLTDTVFGVVQDTPPEPHIPVRSRVSIRKIRDGEPYFICGWTMSPPVLDSGKRWMVAVSTYDEGIVFKNTEDVIFKGRVPCTTQR